MAVLPTWWRKSWSKSLEWKPGRAGKTCPGNTSGLYSPSHGGFWYRSVSSCIDFWSRGISYLVLRTFPLETALEGAPGVVQAALVCTHWPVGLPEMWLRPHSYIQKGFRGSHPFLVFHGAHNGPKQTILLVLVLPKNTEQGINSSTVFSKQAMKPRMRDKCEPSPSPCCHLGMLVPRVTTDTWDIWDGFMWVQGFGSLCVGNPSSSAHSPDRQLLPLHDNTQTEPLQSWWRRMFWLGSKIVLTVTSSDV